LVSSTSSARKARGLNAAKSLEQEAGAAWGRLNALEGRMEIENGFKEFEELLKG
jgi:hypothetical protein